MKDIHYKEKYFFFFSQTKFSKHTQNIPRLLICTHQKHEAVLNTNPGKNGVGDAAISFTTNYIHKVLTTILALVEF